MIPLSGNSDYIGTEIMGQFKILEMIGKGGMGSVYKAWQKTIDRYVAVKILNPRFANRTDIVTRFRREARAMSKLTHPNTVKVYLYGQLENGVLYIIMEYLEGKNLAQIEKDEGPIDLGRSSRILIQVLGALEEAHQKGIVHRDLKPENIFLTNQGGIKDFPKVLDFGLAKLKEQNIDPESKILTREGMVFGTPEFMSPEQAQGKELDPRSDIYSLGLIFYEMLTSKLPFIATHPMDYITHHIKSKPTPITSYRPDLPPEIEYTFCKFFAKNKEDRFSSAQDVALNLKKYLPENSMDIIPHAMPIKNQPICISTQSLNNASPEDSQIIKNYRGKIAINKGLFIGLIVIITFLICLVVALILIEK